MKINREKECVSVAMATYNGEKFIMEQITSILKNLTEYDELVISDDGSKDKTAEIVKELMKQDTRIHFFLNSGKGVKQNFENAIRHCQNKYIFLCDQDDIWNENKVETVLKTFQETGKKIVLHNASLIDGSGNDIPATVYDYRNSKAGYLKNLYKNSYMGCCMAFDASILDTVLPIPDVVDMHDSWIGLLGDLHHWVCVIPDILIKYRRHGNNVTEMNKHQSLPDMVKKRVIYLLYTMKRSSKRR